MLQKQHINLKAKEPPENTFSKKEKEFLDLICNFLVDDIFNKVNNDKKEGNRLCED